MPKKQPRRPQPTPELPPTPFLPLAIGALQSWGANDIRVEPDGSVSGVVTDCPGRETERYYLSQEPDGTVVSRTWNHRNSWRPDQFDTLFRSRAAFLDDETPTGAPPPVQRLAGWDDIVGMEYAKRAMEVAIAGQHTMLVIAHPRQQGEAIARVAREHGVQAGCVLACPCGWLGDDKIECTCSVEAVVEHKARHIADGYDIYVETYRQDPSKIVDHFMRKGAGYPTGERMDVVLARAEKAKEFGAAHTSLDIDEAGASLMRSFVRQLDAGPDEVDRAPRVARTIANLAGEDKIHTAHLAEAMQYRHRR